MADHEPLPADLVERLRALGEHPIDPALQAAHLTAMSAPRAAGLRPKLRVAAAFLAGLLVGGSGLAVAGALPDPAQNLAHRAFKKAGIEVPQPERYHDDAECGPEVMANHGGYVRADRSKAQTECGKPVKGARGGPGERKANREGAGPADRGPCEGPPPWATDRSMSPEAKATAQAERRAACGDDGEGDEAEGVEEAERSGSGGSPPADAAVPADPTTTTTGSTTTVLPTSTTSDGTTTTAAG